MVKLPFTVCVSFSLGKTPLRVQREIGVNRWYPDRGTVSVGGLSRPYFPNSVYNPKSCSNLLFFEFFYWGGGYFANPTLNTKSKSAIFEFSGGGGYFDNPTLSTKSKSAIFDFFFLGGGYFANPTLNTKSKSAIFEFSGGGG